MSYRLSKEEQEVHLWWDAADKTVHAYTAYPLIMHKLDKMCADHPEEYQCIGADTVGGQIISKEYRFDSKYIRFGKPASAKQREAARTVGAKNLKHA